MSKALLIITAVVVESRKQSEVAAAYGVSVGWVSRLVARYRCEGEASFEPRSRQPKTSPNATAPRVVDLTVTLHRQLTLPTWTPRPTRLPGTCVVPTASGSHLPGSAGSSVALSSWCSRRTTDASWGRSTSSRTSGDPLGVRGSTDRRGAPGRAQRDALRRLDPTWKRISWTPGPERP